MWAAPSSVPAGKLLHLSEPVSSLVKWVTLGEGSHTGALISCLLSSYSVPCPVPGPNPCLLEPTFSWASWLHVQVEKRGQGDFSFLGVREQEYRRGPRFLLVARFLSPPVSLTAWGSQRRVNFQVIVPGGNSRKVFLPTPARFFQEVVGDPQGPGSLRNEIRP